VRRARGDLSAVAAHLRSCAGWADKLEYACFGPTPQPVGVLGVLVTGALPAVVRRVAPALACGNAVVLVPDPDAPLGALVLAEVVAEAGLPDGVLNVLPGGSLGGEVDGVAVTGPPAFCRDVARLARGRRVSRELTGGLVQVVHDDAPLDQAVDGIVEALGDDQRVLVAESVADELGELLRERLARLRVGDPLDHNTDLGPTSSAERRDRAVALATAADDEGARRWTSPTPLPERGWFLAPTVFTDVAPTMRVARAEIPGPVLPVLTFRTPAEAVTTAGAPRMAAVWADKGSRALWTAQRLRAGVVWVNAVNRWEPAAPAAALADHLIF
jgi:aldehyde dehydrogenase (NAD+)